MFNTKKTKKNITTDPYIELTRVYVKKGAAKLVLSQKYRIRKSCIESYRPNNTVGTARTRHRNRCTIRTVSGLYVHVKERFSEVEAKLKS